MPLIFLVYRYISQSKEKCKMLGKKLRNNMLNYYWETGNGDN